jgi:hypothetical protein
VRYVKVILKTAPDWQAAQHALAEHGIFGPWIADAGDDLALCQSIIRDSEEALGEALPY